MPKQFVKGIYTFIISIFFLIGSLNGQSCVLPVSLENRIAKAKYIVEGEIVNQVASWDTNFKSIYTIHKMAVHTRIKGDQMDLDSILLVTRGGRVGNILQVDHPELVLRPGQKGLFFMSETDVQLMEKLKSEVLLSTDYSLLGFIQYDAAHKSASDALDKYDDIVADLYSLFEREGYEVENGYALISKEVSLDSRAITMSSFTPTSLIAGGSNQITVNGSGFGSSQGNGYVGFSNADDGGSTYVLPLNSQYISWSDSEIVLEVPSRAGTGSIVVQNDGNENVLSSGSLYIDYNLSNVGYDGDAYRPNLVDADGSGGYELVFHNGLNDDADAKNAFLRALNSWRCSNSGGTGIYLETGGSTTTQGSANDEENLICFDSGELSSNTLGRTTSWYSGCSSGGSFDWYLEEVDMVFNESPGSSSYFWNFDGADNSTASNEYDFESVALHELGHLHQLGHVNNFSNIMYFSIGNGVEKRALEQSDLDGGADVLNHSQGVCTLGDMIADFICSILPLESLSLDAQWMEHGQITVRFSVQASHQLKVIELFKSTDGSQFNTILKLKDPDPFRTDYHFTDGDINDQNYYQLLVVDEDGMETMSEVVLLRSEQHLNSPNFYPNPVGNVMTISASGQEQVVQVRIKDLNGRVLKTFYSPLPNQLDVQDLPTGPFLLEYTTNHSVQTLKMLKN